MPETHVAGGGTPPSSGGGDPDPVGSSRIGSQGSNASSPSVASHDEVGSLDSSWNWNQAQTADGRTYYFNEKKEVKWTLTLEEKMKMLQTLELR